MPLLEEILARKQSLIICSNSMAASAADPRQPGPAARPHGLAQLASHSSVGDQLLAQSDVLNQLLAQCQGQRSMASRSSFSKRRPPTSCAYFTAANLRRFTTPGLHLAPGQAAPAQPGLSLSMRAAYQDANMLAKCSLLRVVVFCLEIEEPCSTP
jgi:hypothetical protein